MIQEEIENTLKLTYQPEFLRVENESHQHASGLHSESHFKVTLVSHNWQNLNRVKRHQSVYATLAHVMPEIHALALHLYTPDEWQTLGEQRPDSPLCNGGSA